ncbi:LPS export ABC transporter permease LptF [Thiocapsa imhoffii]|uniref:Lipopolysaccharide export system permease protein LptF n=1 Tax=Thiocapsa imhoffii TaxID=382777 RepID=A0A9X0WJZ7_9GAMM|nr:LPS export ABC transporter permease LptF [Thiocapsa imhoffii]MBK1645983.1 LPS export ABC transporter permease LptF [Thiocapsa imhoffii]
MLGIVDRYLLLEATKVLVAIVAVLMMIVASLLFLRTLEEVNAGALSVHLVVQFLGYKVLGDLARILPPAFFLAVLVTLTRLSKDSELIAMGACGIGPGRLLRGLLVLAVPVAVVAAWLSLVVQPWAAAGVLEIRFEQNQQTARVAGLQAGRFYLDQGGQVVLYIGEMDRQQSLGDVFILDRRDEVARLVVSDGGHHRVEPESGDHLVVLSRGHRFDGVPGSAAFLIGDFNEYFIRIRASHAPLAHMHKRSTTPSLELLRSDDLADRAELEDRLAMPLAILVLTIIAIPLVSLSPRQRSSARLTLAFLAYFSFFNLQRLAETWLATGVTPVWLTSFWYQFVILGVVYLVLLPDSLWMKRTRAAIAARAPRATRARRSAPRV